MTTKPAQENLLFIDKYRPKSFGDIKFNQDVAKKFIACAKTNDIPHIVIKGPKGSGKKTFSNLYVMSKYGKTELKVRQQQLEIKHASKSIEMQFLYSHYHYHIDPSAYGVYDRLIIQGFIKDILQAKPINDNMNYHLIVIENADKLTQEAQQSLRRTLEKYMNNCRFIFIISQESTLIEPLMSRCVQLRLSAPSYVEIEKILSDICISEEINALPSQLKQIAIYSKRNINSAIDLLQLMSICYSNELSGTIDIDFRTIVEIDQYIDDVTSMLIDNCKKNPKVILSIRLKLYDLLVHCVEPIDIMKKIFRQIFDISLSDKDKHQLIQILSKYENTLKQGSKPIYHLEGFIVSIMNLLSNSNT